jgi:hypothetical protein
MPASVTLTTLLVQVWLCIVTDARAVVAAFYSAHIAQFIRVEGDVIAEIETYDCYEPIA